MKKAYLNKGQRAFRNFAPKSAVIVAGRRFGKSDGILGPVTQRNIQHMPRSAGAVYQVTFKQLFSRTIPSTLAFLDRYGFKEDIHYYIGKKAPKKAGFKEPHLKPRGAWDKVIHFYNGSIIHLLSQDVQFAANSLTLDWLEADETRSLNKTKLFEEVIPAISGAPGKFMGCPWHKGMTLVSDMPTSKQGQWVKDMEKIMLEEENMEVISAIKGQLFEIGQMQIKYHDLWDKFPDAIRRYKHMEEELNFLRSHAFMYFEFDTIENIEIVRPEYIAEMKRNLPPVIFYTSIMNKHITKLTNGFYSNLNESHYYEACDESYLNNMRTKYDTLDVERISNSNDCRQDSDIDTNQPLCISMDYNANINWVVTGQRVGHEARVLGSIYTKNEEKVRQVVRNWCAYYKYHLIKQVNYYYSQEATAGSYAVEDGQMYCEIVVEELTKGGFFPNPVYMGAQWNQRKKHQIINDALRGDAELLIPKLNRSNNQFLIPALEMAGVRKGYKGFEKDKSGEKLAETTDNPLELRTDGTDAFDGLFRGLQFFPQNTINNFSTIYN